MNMNNDQKTCFIYCRVSTEEQAKEGYSIEAQTDICTKKAHELEYEILETFKDEGQSATVSNRPEFLKMLEQIDTRKVGAIIVYNTDRFARNATDHFLIKEQLKKAGTRLISVVQPMLDESPEGRLLDTFMAGINEFYSRDLGRKTKRGLDTRWNNGWYPTGVTYGYLNIDKEGRIAGKKRTPERQQYIDSLPRKPLPIEVDPIHGPLMKEVFKRFATGKYSVKRLGLFMYTKGLTTVNGKPLAHSTIQQILTNPFYYGLMKQETNNRERMGNHEPLISKPLFDLCQVILAKHRGFAIRERKYDYLLRGIIFCADCGLRYTAEPHPAHSKKRDTVHYYHCQKRKPCKAPYVEADDLENKVASHFRGIKFTKGFTDALTAKVRRYLNDRDKEESKVRKGYLNERAGLIRRRRILEEDVFSNALFNREANRRLRDEVEEKIKNVDKELAKLESSRKFDFDLLEEVLALTRDIPKAYKEAPDFLKKSYLRFFFEKLEVHDKKIANTVYSPLVQELIDQQAVILRTNLLPRVDSNHEP